MTVVEDTKILETNWPVEVAIVLVDVAIDPVEVAIGLVEVASSFLVVGQQLVAMDVGSLQGVLKVASGLVASQQLVAIAFKSLQGLSLSSSQPISLGLTQHLQLFILLWSIKETQISFYPQFPSGRFI